MVATIEGKIRRGEDMSGYNRRIPKWESELWSYVSSSGKHCPLYNCCQARQQGAWCLDDNRKHIERLVEKKTFNSRNFDFIEGAPLCRVFGLVERLAEKYLKMGRICQPPVPVDIIRLADDQHPVEVRQPPLKAYHGAIWRLREGWVIQLRNDDPSATKRFTLFHEVFHILAHRSATPVFSKRRDKRGRGHTFNEMLADTFAAYILMPRQWVKEKWAEVKDLDKMAKIFDVPKPAMSIRLREMGLI